MRNLLVLSLASVATMLSAAGCSSAPPDVPADVEVGSTSQAISGCGLMPKAPPCNIVRCIGGEWDFSPLAAGSSCHTSAGTGTCNANGSCVVQPPKTGTMYPSYYVMSLLYAAPGAMSEVDYGTQSTVGSEVDAQHLFKSGVQVQVGVSIAGNGTSVQYGFADGGVDGTSFEVSKTTASTLSLVSSIDSLSHMNDTFYLWTNAEIDMTQVGGGPVQTALKPRGGASPQIVPVTVAELKNPSLIPAWKAAYLTALTPSDYASLATLDPLVPHSLFTGPLLEPQPNPSRYKFIAQMQLDGPDHAGDPIPGFGIAVTNESTSGTVTGYNSATTLTATFSAGFSLFDVLNFTAQGSETFEWDYQKTTQSKQGSQQTATVTLRTGTVGYHDVVNVWYDTQFNSFAFVHPAPTLQVAAGAAAAANVSLLGTALTAAGAPLANQPVTVTFANGVKRTVITNAQGTYRVYDAPEGEATISNGRDSTKVSVVSGREIPVALRFTE